MTFVSPNSQPVQEPEPGTLVGLFGIGIKVNPLTDTTNDLLDIDSKVNLKMDPTNNLPPGVYVVRVEIWTGDEGIFNYQNVDTGEVIKVKSNPPTAEMMREMLEETTDNPLICSGVGVEVKKRKELLPPDTWTWITIKIHEHFHHHRHIITPDFCLWHWWWFWCWYTFSLHVHF